VGANIKNPGWPIDSASKIRRAATAAHRQVACVVRCRPPNDSSHVSRPHTPLQWSHLQPQAQRTDGSCIVPTNSTPSNDDVSPPHATGLRGHRSNIFEHTHKLSASLNSLENLSPLMAVNAFCRRSLIHATRASTLPSAAAILLKCQHRQQQNDSRADQD